MKHKLVIPGELPSTNDMTKANRYNRYTGGEQKKNHTEQIAWIAKGYPRISKKVDLVVTWYCKDRKRDPDNIDGGIKFILDGLVTAGVLVNDGWKNIGDITHRHRVDRDNPRVEVELIERRG